MKRPAQYSLFDELQLADNSPHKYANYLLSCAVALGARSVIGWTDAERRLTERLTPVDDNTIASLAKRIRAGDDPLGEFFCQFRSAEERRSQGATYTPDKIVTWMVRRAVAFCEKPVRVIDPGVGSARFLVSAGRVLPQAGLVGIEIDPLAAILARANLAVHGMADRSKIIVGDYRTADVGVVSGRTLYLANPPYVRHHQIEPMWKHWLADKASSLGMTASQLAGMHVHFFLATALRARPKDFGAFITAAEWLDVNYGSLVRELFLGPLGGKRIDVVEPTALPFPDAASTAAITFFEIGERPKQVALRRVKTLDGLEDSTQDRMVRRERLEAESRWSHLTRPGRKGPRGYVELGELFRVHRGQVTGANKFWIAGEHSQGLPDSVLYPTVTKARELIAAGKVLTDATTLRQVIDLPADLDVFSVEIKKLVERFIAKARRLGVHEGYIASNRRSWWSVGLKQPAPILATYMARRPPAFVRNRADARHINIAHGLYPRESFGESVYARLIEYLSSSVRVTDGRTYAGGLTKFEPREMERLLIPSLELLRQPETA